MAGKRVITRRRTARFRGGCLCRGAVVLVELEGEKSVLPKRQAPVSSRCLDERRCAHGSAEACLKLTALYSRKEARS